MTEPHMLAHATDPKTSEDAAAIAALSPASREIKSAILRLLRVHGPRTAFELRDLYFDAAPVQGWPPCQPNTINRRLSDLRNSGFVHEDGRTRKSPDGRDAAVWRPLTPTERRKLLAYHGLEPLVDVETDWNRVSDPVRLRSHIRTLTRLIEEKDREIKRLNGEVDYLVNGERG